MNGLYKSASQELVAFDYDGTIAEASTARVAPAVLLGIEALWHAGVMTTVMTARPYQRLAKLSWGTERIVSSDTPFATERGARVVSGNSETNLNYHRLAQDELEAIVDIKHDIVDFIGFYPEELQGASYIWTPDTNKRQAMAAKFGHDAIILGVTGSALGEALGEAQPCLVTVKFNEDYPDNKSVLPAGLNTAWDKKSVSIVTGGVDKFTALEVLCEATGVLLPNTSYAGNDENDLPVLGRPELKERIFVGSKKLSGMAEPIVHIASPNILGEYFMQMSGVKL